VPRDGSLRLDAEHVGVAGQAHSTREGSFGAGSPVGPQPLDAPWIKCDCVSRVRLRAIEFEYPLMTLGGPTGDEAPRDGQTAGIEIDVRPADSAEVCSPRADDRRHPKGESEVGVPLPHPGHEVGDVRRTRRRRATLEDRGRRGVDRRARSASRSGRGHNRAGWLAVGAGWRWSYAIGCPPVETKAEGGAPVLPSVPGARPTREPVRGSRGAAAGASRTSRARPVGSWRSAGRPVTPPPRPGR